MTDQVQEQKPEESAQPASPPNSRKKLVMTAGGVLAGAISGALLLGPALSPATGAKDGGAAEPEAHAEPAAPVAQPHMIENLVVNPAGSRGTRFLLVSVGVIMSTPVADDELRRRDTEARDRVVQTLSAKTVEELVEVSRRDLIKRDIAAAIDSLFTSGARVKSVLLPQFVIQ